MLGEFLAGLALVFYAVNIILAKYGSGRIAVSTGFLVSVAVNVVFSAALALMQLGWRTTPLVWNWHGILFFLLAGVFSTYLGRWFFFESVARFGPARASIFQISVPVFTVLLASVFLGERLPPAALAGLALAVLGLLMVVYIPGAFARYRAAPKRADTAVATRLTVLKWMFQSSVILGFSAGMAYAVGNVLRGSALGNWDEPIIGGLLGAISGIVLHVLSSPRPPLLWQEVKEADRRGVMIFAATGVLNISAQILIIASLRYTAVSITTLIASCVPILVIPMSYFLFRNQEIISARTICGTLLALAGITLILLR